MDWLMWLTNSTTSHVINQILLWSSLFWEASGTSRYLNMKALFSFKTSGTDNPVIWYHISAELGLQANSCSAPQEISYILWNLTLSQCFKHSTQEVKRHLWRLELVEPWCCSALLLLLWRQLPRIHTAGTPWVDEPHRYVLYPQTQSPYAHPVNIKK